MKRISKTTEPGCFKEWKLTNALAGLEMIWKDLQNPEKRKLHQALMNEQGHICCYCQQRIIDTDSHIEHFRPRSEEYTHLIFDYKNLHASCQQSLQPCEPRQCGMSKDNWFDEKLMISPLSKDCETRFRYTLDGSIYPADEVDNAAIKTIKRCALDLDKLQDERKKAIEGVVGEDVDLQEDEIKRLIVAYRVRDEDGKFEPFAAMIIHVLEKLKE